MNNPKRYIVLFHKLRPWLLRSLVIVGLMAVGVTVWVKSEQASQTRSKLTPGAVSPKPNGVLISSPQSYTALRPASVSPVSDTGPRENASELAVDLSKALPGFAADAEQFADELESSQSGHSFHARIHEQDQAIRAAFESGNTTEAAQLRHALETWEHRQQADALSQANRAFANGDWVAAINAYERCVALGEGGNPQVWWYLAQGLSHRKPATALAIGYSAYLAYERDIELQGLAITYLPDWASLARKHFHGPALLIIDNSKSAAYLAYQNYLKQKPRDIAILLPALELLVRNLAAQHDYLGEIRLLEAMYRSYPGNVQLAGRLKKAITNHGFQVQRVTPDVNVFPPRVCVHFSARLSDAPNFHASTWVSFQPARPRAVAVLQNGGVCIRGLPAGSTTELQIRAGLPAIDGAVLPKMTRIKLSLPDRSSKIISDTGRFIIPANLPPAVGFSTINVSKVKIRINRVPQRALIGFLSNHPLLQQDAYTSVLTGQNSKTVWRGTTNIPHFTQNRLVHTILPLPRILGKPGLYAIQIDPGDGTPNPFGDLGAVQLVLRTNLAPTIWRGHNGLYVQVRHYTTARVWPGVKIELIAKDNDILETKWTHSLGVAHFPQSILRGRAGQSPDSLHIYGPGKEFTLVDLHNSPLNLSGRGISGRAALHPVSPYLWLDRGIYRPGETVHVTAIYRSAAGRPLDLPLHLIVRRPGGQVFLDVVPKLRDDDAIITPVRLPRAAQGGIWSVSLATGLHEPVLARANFTVAAFVPPMLAVHLGHAKPVPAGGRVSWPVRVRYLYGAPGAHLSGVAQINIQSASPLYPRWKHYHFGLSSEVEPGMVQTVTLPATNAAGLTRVPINLTRLPDSTRFQKARLSVSINEPSGRWVNRRIQLPIIPDHPLIGIREEFRNHTVASGKTPVFHIAAIRSGGTITAIPVLIRVVRQSPEWDITMNYGVASWTYSYINHPVLTRGIMLPEDHPYDLRLPALDYGRYRLRVAEAHGGLAASSVIFYSGWQTSGNPAVPQRVSVRSSAPDYAAGSDAKIHVSAPFAGPAVLVLANDRILKIRDFSLPKRGRTLRVRIHGRWGAGAYALIDVFRPATASQAPERAIGLTWLGLRPGHRAIPLHLSVRHVYRPLETIRVPVKTRPGAYVTLAAVDQGILNLTQFPNPNPLHYFFGKRRLDIRVFDEYGDLLARPQGFETLLENGAGASFGPAVRPIPQKVVAIFAGPVQANSEGLANLPITIPEFDGELHLMAVTWKANAMGASHASIIVRNRLIANLLLPRILAPGDTAQASVMLQNLKLPAGMYRSTVNATGSVRVVRGATHAVRLSSPAMHLLPVTMTGTGDGTARLTLAVTGPDGYHLVRHWQMVVHSTQIPVTRDHLVRLGGEGELTLRPDNAGFIAGSTRSAVTLGNILPFDPGAYVQALYHSWHYSGSLLTAASKGLPLTVLRPPLVSRRRLERLQHYVGQVLNDQRYDGAFGLWSDMGRAQPWLTAFATEFLLRAEKNGATVPRATLQQSLTWLRHELVSTDHTVFDRVYAAYDLSLAGEPPAGAIRLLAMHLSRISMPLTLAQLGVSLNIIGERHQALRVLRMAMAMHEPKGKWWWKQIDWDAAFGSPLRDEWAVSAIIAQSGLMPHVRLRSNLPGAGLRPSELTSQELAWALYADGVLGGSRRMVYVQWNHRVIDRTGPVILTLTGATVLHNLGRSALPVSVTTTGITQTPLPAAVHGMVVHRLFYTLGGRPLQPDSLPQNTVFVMVLKGAVTDDLPHLALLNVGLPPGWEPAGSLAPGHVQKLPWLSHTTTPETVFATDDRYEAAFGMAPQGSYAFQTPGMKKFKIAVLLRAVTPGSYTLPGVSLSDMYHPSVFARTSGRRVIVTPGAH